MWSAFRVRRTFQWQGFIYAPPGPCECSKNPGSDTLTNRVTMLTGSQSGSSQKIAADANPCQDTNHCNGFTATACVCHDAGYCSCRILPYMYGGDIWLAREGDPRQEHILNRRFVIYDPSISPGDELVEEELYKLLQFSEPNPDRILFPPQGESITASQINGKAEVPQVSEESEGPSPVVKLAMEAAGISEGE